MVYSIVYISSAVKLLDDRELRDILIESRINNAHNQVTGVLMYCNGNIIQVLEGEELNVKETFSRILRDSRHRQIIKVFSGAVADRSFPTWLMGYQSLTSKEMKEIKDGIPLLNPTRRPETANHVISLLQNFYINNFRN